MAMLPPPPKNVSSSPTSEPFTMMKIYTPDEVAKHNTLDDCWIILDCQVYDLTQFLSRHPGGRGPLFNAAGKDGTTLFMSRHPWINYKDALHRYLIGICRAPPRKAWSHSPSTSTATTSSTLSPLGGSAP